MLPAELTQIDVENYRNEQALPPGKVLIIGSGESGCQIAEELSEAGRDVVVACGRTRWLPRRFGDRDLVWWFHETGFLVDPVSALPSPEARLFGHVQAPGHGGGHDLHYRTLQEMGVTLVGRLVGAEGRRARFAPDLGASVAWGDERSSELAGRIRKHVAERARAALSPAKGTRSPKAEPSTAGWKCVATLADEESVAGAGGRRREWQERLYAASGLLAFVASGVANSVAWPSIVGLAVGE